MSSFFRVVFLMLFFCQFSYSQDVDVNKINNDTNDYSDEQVKKFIDSVSEKGMTLEQAFDLMKAKGISESKIQKLKDKISDFKANNTLEDEGEEEEDLKNEETNELLFGYTEKEKVPEVERDSLYGYDFFNNPKINFSPNINVAVPENYQLSKGDEIEIELWGASQKTYRKKLNRQGSVILEDVGRIKLSGLSFKQAKTKIKSYLSRVYSGINEPSSSYNKVYVGVTLSEIRTVQVNLVGEVKTPGTYSLTSLSTVLNALYAAGGPTKQGNFRKVSLVRNGQRLCDFDFYKYLTEGAETGNRMLKDQDVIIVGAYDNLVKVIGEVKRPGYYQVNNTEKMSDILVYCGGFTSNAYRNSIIVNRIKDVGRSVVEFKDVDANKVSVFNGDEVIVKKISNIFKNVVSVKGAVIVEGDYQYKEGMTLGELIRKTSGLKKSAFKQRALLIRQLENGDKKAFSISLDTKDDNFVLMSNDEIEVFDINDLREKQTLRVDGAVNIPKTLPFVKGMSVADLIALAGGLKSGADVNNIEVSRRNNEGGFEKLGEAFKLSALEDLGKDSNNKFYLEPYDVVNVRFLKGFSTQKSVEVTGQVNYPGSYVITSRDDRISDLVKRSGGVSKFAFLEGATLIRRKEKDTTFNEGLILNKILKDSTAVVDVEKLNDESFRVGINLVEILKNPKSNFDLLLQEGDELIIPTKKQTVEVRGEVLSPSLVQYIPGKSLGYYINRAGGFSNLANKRKPYIIYNNGSVDATSSFWFFKSYPDVESGSIIVVPLKEQSKSLSSQEVIGITSGLATLALLITNLVK